MKLPVNSISIKSININDLIVTIVAEINDIDNDTDELYDLKIEYNDGSSNQEDLKVDVSENQDIIFDYLPRLLGLLLEYSF